MTNALIYFSTERHNTFQCFPAVKNILFTFFLSNVAEGNQVRRWEHSKRKVRQLSQLMSQPVKVDIEYCTVCGLKGQCEELANFIHKMSPETNVECKIGRQGSFEVQINDTLVHSKLASLAIPEYNDVLRNVNLAAEGKPVSKLKEQPITDCVIQ